LQALLRGENEGGSSSGVHTVAVLERVDEQTQYILGRWPAMGWTRFFLAPRDLLLKRTWRYVFVSATFLPQLQHELIGKCRFYRFTFITPTIMCCTIQSCN
jgi:hypothetical protein